MSYPDYSWIPGVGDSGNDYTNDTNDFDTLLNNSIKDVWKSSGLSDWSLSQYDSSDNSESSSDGSYDYKSLTSKNMSEDPNSIGSKFDPNVSTEDSPNLIGSIDSENNLLKSLFDGVKDTAKGAAKVLGIDGDKATQGIAASMAWRFIASALDSSGRALKQSQADYYKSRAETEKETLALAKRKQEQDEEQKASAAKALAAFGGGGLLSSAYKPMTNRSTIASLYGR